MKHFKISLVLIFLTIGLGNYLYFYYYENQPNYLYEQALIRIQKKDDSGLELLFKAASKKHDKALVLYGNLIEDRKPDDAEIFYKEAINQKHIDAEFYLGKLYLKQGKTNEALTLIYSASTKNSLPALILMSELLYDGIGVEKNKIEAILLLKKAFNKSKDLKLQEKIESIVTSLNSSEQKEFLNKLSGLK